MAMAEIIARCSGRLKPDHGKYVLVNVDAGTSHNVCGPIKIGIFKTESIENAKEETNLGYEAEFSDKDVRFIQSYLFDSLKLVPSTAKGKKVKVFAFTRSSDKACMDVNIAFKFHFSRYLRKPIVVLVPVVVILLAWNFLSSVGHKARFHVASPNIAARSAFTDLCFKVKVEYFMSAPEKRVL